MAELLEYLQQAVEDGASDLFLLGAGASVRRWKAESAPSVRKRCCRPRRNG